MRRRLYVKKHRSYNLFHIIFPPISDRSYGSYMI